MKKLIVDKKYNGKKLDKFLIDNINNLSYNLFYKTLRKKILSSMEKEQILMLMFLKMTKY